MKNYCFPIAAVCLTILVLANSFSLPGLCAAVTDEDTAMASHANASGGPENSDNDKGAYMKLKIGSAAPEFTADDSNDMNRSLSGLIKDGPVVLVFLRGFS
ncbi:MAG TPA: hypothetical protein PLM29_14215 [Deltaproteobacteria bacterium]|nr:hypothetical protein [Deltaproteobacteria bacterium]